MNDISKIGNVTKTAATPKVDGPQHAKLKKATQDFEAVFLGQMLKQMRKSMSGGNALFGNSNEAKMFQEMADEETATQMSKTGSFGLAKTLYESLARTLPNEDAPPAPAALKSGADPSQSAGSPAAVKKAVSAQAPLSAASETLNAPIRNAALSASARFTRKESEAR